MLVNLRCKIYMLSFQSLNPGLSHLFRGCCLGYERLRDLCTAQYHLQVSELHLRLS